MLRQFIDLFLVHPRAGFVPLREPALDALLRRGNATPEAAWATRSAAAAPGNAQVSDEQAGDAPLAFARSAVWAPAASQRVLLAEALVCGGVMAYFAYGLLATLGLA